MKRDRTTNLIIKMRKRAWSSAVLEISALRWLIIIAVLAVILLLISYFAYDCHEWLSNVLTSIACGSFTGLVLYLLTNLRNNKMASIQAEKRSIEAIICILEEIANYRRCYYFWDPDFHKTNVNQHEENVVLLLDKLEETRNELPLSIYDVVAELGYDPIDRDNLEKYKRDIHAVQDNREMQAFLIELSHELNLVIAELKPKLQIRQDQLMFMSGGFF